jgi:hypothetical protein
LFLSFLKLFCGVFHLITQIAVVSTLRFVTKTFAVLAVACALYAQDPTGALEGQVSDPQGAAVSDAVVTVTNSQTGYNRSQTTASDGLYRFALLSIGAIHSRFTTKPLQGLGKNPSRFWSVRPLG